MKIKYNSWNWKFMDQSWLNLLNQMINTSFETVAYLGTKQNASSYMNNNQQLWPAREKFFF